MCYKLRGALNNITANLMLLYCRILLVAAVAGDAWLCGACWVAFFRKGQCLGSLFAVRA